MMLRSPALGRAGLLAFALLVLPLVRASDSPLSPATRSNTKLLQVERLAAAAPDQPADGLSFCFLVSRTAAAQHKFGIKETRDCLVAGESYRASTEQQLGVPLAARTHVHDAAKFAAEHPALAPAIAEAPPRSLIVVIELRGAPLSAEAAVEIKPHVGFGRTADGPPEAEELVFRTSVPDKAASS